MTDSELKILGWIRKKAKGTEREREALSNLEDCDLSECISQDYQKMIVDTGNAKMNGWEETDN